MLVRGGIKYGVFHGKNFDSIEKKNGYLPSGKNSTQKKYREVFFPQKKLVAPGFAMDEERRACLYCCRENV